jgi:hypothetical protein
MTRAAAYAAGASAAVVVMAATGVMIDNPGEIALPDTFRSLAALMAVATAIPLVLSVGPLRLVGLAFPLMLFAVFKFVGLYTAAEAIGLQDLAAVAAGCFTLALLCAACVEPYRRRDPAKVSAFVFVIAASAAAASAGGVALDYSKRKPRAQAALAEIQDAAFGEASRLPSPACARRECAAPKDALPDIIYIVPDRYGSEAALAQFDYDNRPFLAALEAQGFHVAPDARSNYPKTFQSLASSLNMADLDPLFAAMGPASKDKTPLYALIRDNAVQRTLRGLGYSYLHFGNWWEATRKSPYADENVYGLDNIWSKLNEFEHALLRTTPAAWIATYGGFVDRRECERLKTQLDRLERVREERDGPVFVFAHLTIPHDPITMDKEGRCTPHVYYPGPHSNWGSYRAAYAGYLSWLNGRLLEIFDANRASERGLIFVVQADEGPYPRRLHLDGEMNMHEFTDEEIRAKFGIINAIYWDPEDYGPPSLTQTPINNWRIILSKITGAEIPLIEDERSILFKSDEFAWDGRDVTALLERAATPIRSASR